MDYLAALTMSPLVCSLTFSHVGTRVSKARVKHSCAWKDRQCCCNIALSLESLTILLYRVRHWVRDRLSSLFIFFIFHRIGNRPTSPSVLWLDVLGAQKSFIGYFHQGYSGAPRMLTRPRSSQPQRVRSAFGFRVFFSQRVRVRVLTRPQATFCTLEKPAKTDKGKPTKTNQQKQTTQKQKQMNKYRKMK